MTNEVDYQINQPYWHEPRVTDPNIAMTIYSQLKTDYLMFYSWGSYGFKDLDDALRFKVQGRKFKGQVVIKLNLDDTYTILFEGLTEKGWILKEVYEDVYCDQLHELIDEYVET